MINLSTRTIDIEGPDNRPRARKVAKGYREAAAVALRAGTPGRDVHSRLHDVARGFIGLGERADYLGVLDYADGLGDAAIAAGSWAG